MTVRMAMRVTMPDHTVWSIPLGIIAQDRAKYYADQEAASNENWQAIYQQELAADEDDLLDWAHNNMDWDDVRAHATQIATPPPTCDYNAAWSNAPKQIVDGIE